MIFRSLINTVLLASLLIFPFQVLIAQGAPDGKAIFKANCGSCHAKDMKSLLTGPALGGSEANWADYPREDLYAWIRNSQKMIANGHPRAKELWSQYSPTIMTAMPNLTDADIEEVLLYVDNVFTGTGKYAPTVAVNGVAGTEVKTESMWSKPGTLLALLAFLLMFVVILARIIGNLDHMNAIKAGLTPPPRKTFVEIATSKGIIGFVIFAAIVLGGYTTVNNAIDMGRQQGYAPEQPIKFSHATHAGINKIDCQYCHDSARKSKHASIPAVNTCMNCHTAIKVGSEYGTEELTKIYASAGWDPNTGKYIEDYADMKKDSIELMFRTWIDASYRASDEGEGKRESRIKKEVDRQLEGVMANVKMPIVWNRVHNLPDHVYFNHAQHVTVGKVECQTCHGTVEEMEVLEQYSPLSMGWCINCHRETEVKFDGNDYYAKSYEQFHSDLENRKIDKVLVEDVGGLECQKCHY